jgi:S1-C subfamily serine protease
MGRVAVRHARGGAVALLGFAGVVIAHLTLGLFPLNQRSAARAADAPVEQAQQARSVLGDAQPAQARNFRVADNFDIVDLQQQFENVARRVAPAVVAISGADTAMQGDAALRTEEINTDRLSSFLDTVDRTVGTGFVVDSDGYIVTNDHVVGKAEQLWVTTDDHKVYPAIVVGSDPRADIAVLKIPATNLATVKLSDAGPVHRGQWTIALGNPYGLSVAGDMCMSVGIVSATGRSLPKLSGKEDRLYSDLIQTTAQINPGNSGGPLFDLRGEVIGINTAVILPQKQTNGIGFAIPMGGRVMQIINDLKEGREIVYGYLGVKSSTPTARERKAAGIDDEIGAYIDSVDKDSPAGAADLRKGDIVVRFNGEIIRDGDQFIRTVGAAPVGRAVSVSFYRKDKVRACDVVLRRRELSSAAVTRESRRLRWRGMLLGPIPAQWDFGQARRPEGGLMVIGIEPNSPHAKEGIVQGSVITAVAGRAVRDVTDLQRVINDVPPEDWALDVTGRQEVVASTIAGN